MISVRWTLPAQRDFHHIGTRLRRENPPAARTVMKTLYDSIIALENLPHRGRPGRRPATRELVITGLPYIAVYRVTARGVEILRILHHAQDWP